MRKVDFFVCQLIWISINFSKGIKPTLFKAFEKHTKKMAQEIAFAFGEDTKEYVEVLFKELKK